MVRSIMIVDMTQTISRGTRPGTVAADDPFGDIIADFRATLTRIKCAASERLLRLGISMAQLNILYTLQRSGDMTMSQIADGLNVSDSNATGLIDRIEERGFVERTRVPEDRRIVMVRLTDTGRQLLDEADALSDELLRSTLSRVKPSQLAGIANAVAELRAAVESATSGTPDRHVGSTPSPRSPSTIQGVAPAAHDVHGRD
jgi:DNA-binding MarR family transcriptional regulator